MKRKRVENEWLISQRETSKWLILRALNQEDPETCPLTRLPPELIGYIFEQFIPRSIEMCISRTDVLSNDVKHLVGPLYIRTNEGVFEMRVSIGLKLCTPPHREMVYVKSYTEAFGIPVHCEGVNVRNIFRRKTSVALCDPSKILTHRPGIVDSCIIEGIINILDMIPPFIVVLSTPLFRWKRIYNSFRGPVNEEACTLFIPLDPLEFRTRINQKRKKI